MINHVYTVTGVKQKYPNPKLSGAEGSERITTLTTLTPVSVFVCSALSCLLDGHNGRGRLLLGLPTVAMDTRGRDGP